MNCDGRSRDNFFQPISQSYQPVLQPCPIQQKVDFSEATCEYFVASGSESRVIEVLRIYLRTILLLKLLFDATQTDSFEIDFDILALESWSPQNIILIDFVLQFKQLGLI